MIKISAETCAKNFIHNIIDKEKMLWLRNKDIEEKLGVENIYGLIDKEIKGRSEARNPTNEQIREYKTHGSELIDGGNFMYTREHIIMPIMMHCRVSTPEAIAFKTKLEFNQRDLITTKEQSVLTKIMTVFASEKILLHHSVLSYKIDLYFSKHRLAIEFDEKGHNDRNIDFEIEKQKSIEKELDCEFIRINPYGKDFDVYVEIDEIYNHIKESSEKLTKESTEKSFIDKILKRLSELKFKSSHSIKYVV